MVDKEKELALAGDTEEELLASQDKDTPEDESLPGENTTAEAEGTEAEEQTEEEVDPYPAPEPSRLSRMLGILPAVPEFPIAKPGASLGTADEAADEDGEDDDIIDISKEDDDFLFSTDDDMINPPTEEEMEDMAGSGEPEGISEEDQEASEKAQLASLEMEEKEAVSTDDYLFGTDTDGTAGSLEPPKRTTKYTVALKDTYERKRKRTGGVSLSEIDRDLGF